MDRKTIYVQFPEDGITRLSESKHESEHRFLRKLENATMEMMWEHFSQGWRLDGPWEKTATWDSDTKNVFFGLGGNQTRYKGCHVKLRRPGPDDPYDPGAWFLEEVPAAKQPYTGKSVWAATLPVKGAAIRCYDVTLVGLAILSRGKG